MDQKSSFDSQNGIALQSIDIKRLLYSQKHTSNKVMIINGGSNNTNNGDASSNSLVAGGAAAHKVKS